MSIASSAIQGIQRVVALVDLENILFSLPTLTEESVQIEEAFERFSAWLGQIGDTKAIFVFGSERSIFSRRFDFQKLMWFPILCPKIKDVRKGYRFEINSRERDTSDENIIRLWGVLNDMCGDWDVLCIASGDIDFVPMARETLRRGKKIAIAAIEGIPLSKELQEIASVSKAGEPMIHYFYPVK